MTFDPSRRLVMATFKTVLGHNLPAGTALAIVEEPSARGEVDEAMARRLFNGRNAVYAEDARPTPVETPEQEKARLAIEALRDARDGDVVMPDLLVWQADDAEAKKKAGAKVTKDDLILIAKREGVLVETDDNKPYLIRKITERRAAAASIPTNSETDTAANQGLAGVSRASGPESDGDADAGADGDAHGSAGEGEADTAHATD